MDVEYLIIGAGISGLTFANYCDDDYLIIEKENEIGGYCRTIKRNNFVWDYAGHFFHFNTDEIKNLFLENISKDKIIYNKKCSKILYKNQLIDFPFQLNIHQLEKAEFIDCLYDLFNKKEKDKYDNFLDMLYGKFGKSIVEKFLKPYNEKLYATDLNLLDIDAMGRFFPYADIEQIIANMKENEFNSYNQEFLYPVDGAASFINILANKLDKNKILLNTEIIEVNTSKKIVSLNNGQTISYHYLINTSPLNQFLNIVGGYDDLVRDMSYNKVLVYNIGFNKKSENFINEHWLYVPSSDYNFYRVGFYSNILSQEKLSIYVEIGYDRDYVIDDKEIKLQYDNTINNLLKANIINSNILVEDYAALVLDPGYVHINTNTNKKIDLVKQELSKTSIFTIGRYGAWTYNSMEDSMLAAKDLAEKI